MPPDLVRRPADPAGEADLPRRLGPRARRFTPVVALDAPDGLILDTSSCPALFGGEAATELRQKEVDIGVSFYATLVLQQRGGKSGMLSDLPAQPAALHRHSDLLHVRVSRIERLTPGVKLLRLEPVDRFLLPDFELGAHVDVVLGSGLSRAYSLIGPARNPPWYEIAVKRMPDWLGVSHSLHEQVEESAHLCISAPRNQFCLAPDAGHSVFIAGGIGITPIWSMIRCVHEAGGYWELHYACRRRDEAALLDRLEGLGGRCHVHESQGASPLRLDIAAAVAAAPPGSHFYCCGPQPMLAGFRAATAHLPAGRARMEQFAAEQPAAREGGYSVRRDASGIELAVPPGTSLLDAIVRAGVDVPHSCREGVCGSCETRVLEGIPDHRDAFLTEAERGSNTVMMVCCSGARGGRLVLDL
ncbi:2Fe-2S iron-sulfur cluster-binding protein [Roseomonas sp. GCM10028921]